MPADDPVILDLMEGADKVGIDCPLGWPGAFVQFVTTHHNDALALPASAIEAKSAPSPTRPSTTP